MKSKQRPIDHQIDRNEIEKSVRLKAMVARSKDKGSVDNNVDERKECNDLQEGRSRGEGGERQLQGNQRVDRGPIDNWTGSQRAVQ